VVSDVSRRAVSLNARQQIVFYPEPATADPKHNGGLRQFRDAPKSLNSIQMSLRHVSRGWHGSGDYFKLHRNAQHLLGQIVVNLARG